MSCKLGRELYRMYFDGIMDALHLIAQKYPEGRRFMQDNNPKHTSRLATSVLQQKVLIGGGQHPNPQT